MTREQVKARIEGVGIVPGIRVNSREDALYAATTLYDAGIPLAEITMTIPDGVGVIRQLAVSHPEMVVGAGTVLDVETAARCLDAGAKFLTSPGLVREVVEFAVRQGVVVFPGVLTPTEVIAAWKAGADYAKIFPAGPLGFEQYIRLLRTPLPQIPLIASGGVGQQTAASFIRAGAVALGIGVELLPKDAVALRQDHRLHELARRFLGFVQEGRAGA